MFLRFVVPSRDCPGTHAALGVVAVAYELLGSDDVAGAKRDSLLERLRWIEDHFDTPRRFNRTRSKGWQRRNTIGLSWLRAEQRDAVAAMRALASAVEACGVPTAELRAARVGFIVYEDALQVVAEPFRDMRRR